MSKKIQKLYIVGLEDTSTPEVFETKEDLEQAFLEDVFDEDSEVLEVQVVRKYFAGRKLELIEG